MAKAQKPRKSRSNVVPMAPESDGNVAVAEIEPSTPFDPPPAAIAPVAAPPEPPAATPKTKKLTFWERVAAVPKAEWGTRVFIYVYCLEPICNLKMGGESKYLVRLSEPIADEQALMVDYGSGKYRLQMVNRKPGVDKSDAIDGTEIEIYNPKYPPKIPQKVWMNDPRNERWAALLPKEEPPQPPTPLGAVSDAFKTFTEIQKDIREQMTPAPGPPTLPGPPPTDPVEAGLRIANLMMTLKADNPMNEFYRDEMKALREELAEERRETRRLLSEKKTGPGEEKFGIKAAIAEVKDLLPGLKELLPQVGEAARATRSNWIDVFRDIAPPAIDYVGKIAVALIARMPQVPPPAVNGAQPHAALPAPQQQPGQQTQQQQPPPNVPKFVQFLSQPLAFDSFRRYFEGFKKDDGQTGADFAQWVFDGGGAEPLKDARALGSANIMALLKQSPAWIMFQADEAKLSEFIDQTLAWTAPEPEPDDDDDEDDDAVDLTAKGI
jgi:hypothetical protein